VARSVSKSARTGRFISRASAARHPKTSVTQTVGGKAKGYRSAITGKFVKASTAARHPGKTIHEG
jgi:hypothetical protein